MFSNFKDFAAKDENFESSSNIYENSKVRRLDYHQQKVNADQSTYLDKESSFATPNNWTSINAQKSNDSWEN